MIDIRKVTTKHELKQFIQFYYDLYRGSQQAVPYLYFDEMATLRHDKNPSFECCEADYFLALRDNKVVGRYASVGSTSLTTRRCRRRCWGLSRTGAVSVV